MPVGASNRAVGCDRFRPLDVTWLVGGVQHPPVAEMRTAVAAGDRRPEVIEHMGVETEALARLEPDCPHAYTICLK